MPRHEFPLHPIRRVTDWTRAAASERRAASLRRVRRARERARGRTGTLSGEWKKPDTGEWKTHEKEPVTEETVR